MILSFRNSLRTALPGRKYAIPGNPSCGCTSHIVHVYATTSNSMEVQAKATQGCKDYHGMIESLENAGASVRTCLQAVHTIPHNVRKLSTTSPQVSTTISKLSATLHNRTRLSASCPQLPTSICKIRKRSTYKQLFLSQKR